MNRDFDFEEVGKRMPYRTPEGFFENVQTNVLKRADEWKKRRRVSRLKWGISVALATAAMICGFLFLPNSPKEGAEQATHTAEWLAEGSSDAMDVYLSQLSDEELQDWIEFSENDIFYELTTETENYDEN